MKQPRKDNMDLKQQAKNVAAQGRFGDSMLLHVNPAEMKGIASSMPITINPETGQPEAFLPFLAPILGSLGFSALAGTGALGATLAAKPLLASAIGSGLAQTAVTGDLKKGILAGITGYGVGSALQSGAAAAGANVGETIATDVVTDAGLMGTQAGADAISQAASQAGAEAAKTAAISTPAQNLRNIFGNPTVGQNVVNPLAENIGGIPTLSETGFAGAQQGFGQGLSNLATGFTDPSAYIPIGIGAGTTGVMMSQEAFEEQLKQMGIDAEERKRRIREMYPENIPVASGGVLKFQEGKSTSLDMKDNYINYLQEIEKEAFRLSRQAPGENPTGLPMLGARNRIRAGQNYIQARKDVRNALRNLTDENLEAYNRGDFKNLSTGIAKKEIEKYLNFAEANKVVDKVKNINRFSGGALSFQDGGITFDERFVPPVANPFRMNTQAIQRVPNPIDPNFMPGFQPEFTYFQNLNPSATAIESGAQGIMGVNQPSVGPFNPTATPGYNQFYGAALGAAPQVLNPFAPITPFTPIPPSIPTTPPDDGRGDRDDTPPPPPPDDMPPPKPPIDIPIDGPLIPPIGKGGPGTKPPSIDRIDDFVDLPTPLVPPMDGPVIPNIPVIPTGGDFSIQRDDIGMRPLSIGGVGGTDMEDRLLVNEGTMLPTPIAPPIDNTNIRPLGSFENPLFTQIGIGLTGTPVEERSERLLKPLEIPRRDEMSIDRGPMLPRPLGSFENPLFTQIGLGLTGTPVEERNARLLNPIVPPPQPNIPLINPAILNTPVNTIPQIPIMSPPMLMAEGESTEVQVDKLPEGLKAMYDSGPKGREGVEKIAAKTDKFQEGRSTSIMQDEVTMELVKFLRGETDDDSIIAKFLEKYGNEAFMQVRQAVLQNIIPGAQTQGMIQGNNQGGMDDDINGLIGATQPVAVSQDEYIIPADVVSDLGDGSSDAGAKKLDQLLDRVRMAKTGTTKQASPIKDKEVMPA